MTLARAEGLEAHRASVELRIAALQLKREAP
jgi:histidinol dehydrogenase